MNLLKISKFSIIGIPVLLSGSISLFPSINSNVDKDIKINKIFNNNFDNNKRTPFQKITYQKYLNQISQYHSNGYRNVYRALGDGYDETTGKSVGGTIFNTDDTSQSWVTIRGVSTEASFSSEENNTQLIKDLGVSANLRFGFKSLGTEASVNFFNDSQTNYQNLSLSFSIKSTVAMRFHYDNLDFNQLAKKEIANAKISGDWSEFQEKYSNKFISHELARREIFVNLNISSTDIKTRNKISGSLGVHYGLSSIKAAINSLSVKEQSNLSLKMLTTTLPQEGKQTTILPENLPLTVDNFSKYTSILESNSEKFVNDYHVGTKGFPDNASDWFPEAVTNKDDLTKYSDLKFTSTKIVNPYEDLMKKYPELNKYFDEAITLNEDSIYINKNKNILKPSPEENNILPKIQNIIQELDGEFSSLFSNSIEINDLLNNHNEQPILTKVEKLSNNILKYGGGLKVVDYIYHTFFRYNGSDFDKIAYVLDMQKVGNSFRLFIESDLGKSSLVLGSNFVFTEKTYTFLDGSTKKLWTPDSIYIERNNKIASYIIKKSDFSKIGSGYSIETIKPNSGIGILYAKTILISGLSKDNIYDQQ